jgi:hypothetical protein
MEETIRPSSRSSTTTVKSAAQLSDASRSSDPASSGQKRFRVVRIIAVDAQVKTANSSASSGRPQRQTKPSPQSNGKSCCFLPIIHPLFLPVIVPTAVDYTKESGDSHHKY